MHSQLSKYFSEEKQYQTTLGLSRFPKPVIPKVGSAEPQGSIDKSKGFHELYLPV